MIKSEKISRQERDKIASAVTDLAWKLLSGKKVGQVVSEAARFRECGQMHRVYSCPSCSHGFRMQVSCNSRICPSCGTRLFNRLERDLYDQLSQMWAAKQKTYGPKLLTLTFNTDRWSSRTDRGLTAADIDRAQREVRQFVIRFYHRYYGKRSKRSGHWYLTKTLKGCGSLVVFEVGQDLNLHAHCLVYGPVIDQAKLSRAWLEITGDSSIVDIRAARRPRQALRYILKYISKPPVASDPFKVALWLLSVRGRRRFASYGIFFGLRSRRKYKRIPLWCPFDNSELDFVATARDPQLSLLSWRSYADFFNHETRRFENIKTYLGIGARSPDQLFVERVRYESQNLLSGM